jgi:acetyl esterase/lipase
MGGRRPASGRPGRRGSAGSWRWAIPCTRPAGRSSFAPNIWRGSASRFIVQGARDAFGTPEELRPALAPLGAAVTLHVVEGGDHSFKVPKRGPVTQEDVFERVQDEIARWIGGLAVRAA